MANLVSIIIPIYQVEKFLEECVNSVLAQTYPNLEILLIDDGSTDKSGAICEDYAVLDPRIKVIHTKHRGLSAARNIGLDMAAGEWVGFVDSDDRIDPKMIGSMYDAATRTNSDLCICGDFLWDRKGLHRRPAVSEERILKNRDELVKSFLAEGIILSNVWNKLYRRELFQNVRFPEGKVYEDSEVTAFMMEKGASAVCIPDCLYYYRRRKNSIVNTHNLENEYDHWTSYNRVYGRFLLVFPQYRSQIIKKYINVGWRFCRCYNGNVHAEKNKYKQVLEEIRSFARSHINEVLLNAYPVRAKVKILLESFPQTLLCKVISIFSLYRIKRNEKNYF